MRMGMATDHGGWPVQEALLRQLRAAGHEVVDFGAHHLSEDDDYPDYVVPLARAVAALEVERGVAICGSGVGASVCANKVRGYPCGAHPRPLLCQTRGRGRSPEHPVYGRQDRRTSRRLGPRPDVPGRQVQSGRATPAALGQSRCRRGRQSVGNTARRTR